MATRIELTNDPTSTLYLDAPDPFVDFQTSLRNLSVYTVTFKKLEGSITFREYPLQGQLEVVEGSYELRHAQCRPLILRQYLQPSLAQEIKEKGAATLRTVYSSLCFTYQDYAGNPKDVRIAFGGSPFIVKT